MDNLLDFFWEDWKSFYLRSPQAAFLSPIKEEIEDSLVKTDFSFSVDTWAKCVFLGLKNYEKAKRQTLDVLRVFWQARYISFVLETKNFPPNEVEKRILGGCKQKFLFNNKNWDTNQPPTPLRAILR